MKDRIRLANLDHDAWKRTMANHAKETALLEVALGKEKHGEVFCDYTKSIADTVYIEDKMLGNMPTSNLTEDNIIDMAAYGCILDLSELQVNIFGFEADVGTIEDASADRATPMKGVADENDSGEINLQRNTALLKTSTSRQQEASVKTRMKS